MQRNAPLEWIFGGLRFRHFQSTGNGYNYAPLPCITQFLNAIIRTREDNFTLTISILNGLQNLKINCFIKKTKLFKNGEATIFIRIIIGKKGDEFGI